MKEINKKWILPMIALLLLSSCMKEMNLDYLRPEPKLVLNGAMTKGEPVAVNLSRTWFYTEEKPELAFPDADVRLYVNDRLQEQLTWYDGDSVKIRQGYFRGTYIPQQDDRLKVTASAGDFPDVSAETTIPGPPTLQALTATSERVERSGWAPSTQCKLQLTIRDTPNQSNFYLIRFETRYVRIDNETGKEIVPDGGYGSSGGWSEMSVNYIDDPLFSSSLTTLDRILGFDWMSYRFGRVFSDDLINGKSYTINVSSSSYYFDFNPEDPYQEVEGVTRHLECRALLYTLTEPYYRYMKAVIEMEDDNTQQTLIDSGLAEPVQLYSNVAGGTGILGGCNVDSITCRVY